MNTDMTVFRWFSKSFVVLTKAASAPEGLTLVLHTGMYGLP